MQDFGEGGGGGGGGPTKRKAENFFGAHSNFSTDCTCTLPGEN